MSDSSNRLPQDTSNYDFGNRLNWDLLSRSTRVQRPIPTRPNSYLRIPDLSIACVSPILMIGVKSSTAEPYWIHGGWASMNLLTIPSVTTEFTAVVEDVASSVQCKLGRLNLVRFPDLNLYPYLLIFQTPYWLEDIYLEVWQYSGPTQSIIASGELVLL